MIHHKKLFPKRACEFHDIMAFDSVICEDSFDQLDHLVLPRRIGVTSGYFIEAAFG